LSWPSSRPFFSLLAAGSRQASLVQLAPLELVGVNSRLPAPVARTAILQLESSAKTKS